MASAIPKLTVQLSKTSDGGAQYLQVMSDDYTTVNVVLIADEIEVKDDR